MVPTLLALALFIAAIIFMVSPRSDTPPPSLSSLLPGFGLGLLALLLLPRFVTPVPTYGFTVGMAVGTVVALLAAWAAVRDESSVPAALGVAGASVAFLLPGTERGIMTVGLLVGVGLAASACLGRGAVIAAATLAAAALANQLGYTSAPESPQAMAGSAYGVGLLGVGLIVRLFSDEKSNFKAWVSPVAFALSVAVTGALGQLWLGSLDLWLVGGLGAFAAWVISLLEGPTSRPSSFKSLLAGALIVGVATLGFSLARGFGMGLALTAVLILGVILKSRLTLLAAGPLASLVIYRFFRETFAESTRAFDLSQHFALVGLLVGLVAVLLGDEWLESLQEGKETVKASGLALVAAAVVGLIPLTGLLLGSRGYIGLLVGLGVGSFVQSIQSGRSGRPLAIAIGAGGASILLFPAVMPLLEVSRDEKIRVLGFTLLGFGVVAGIVLALGRSIGVRESDPHA